VEKAKAMKSQTAEEVGNRRKERRKKSRPKVGSYPKCHGSQNLTKRNSTYSRARGRGEENSISEPEKE